MNTPETAMYEWKTIPWRKLEVKVFKLQQRIYRASLRGNIKTVHKLQRLLMKSWSAKCLAVRRVTQDNQGKLTAGVDGVKSLSPAARFKLVEELEVKPTASPTRRVWIPKPGRDEKRPLGIPVMYDRALQALVKLAIEPEWEAKFEPNSYGFRPGRSCHDAVEAIYKAVNKVEKYVLDADIAKCLDRINHEALLEKIDTFPKLERILRAWLKAGVMDEGKLFPTEEGTPQGGVVSPLLANIALHGLESNIKDAFPESIRINGKLINRWKPSVIRYADDFCVLHRDLSVIQQCQQIVQDWLQGMGLELKPSKTRIAHTLKEVDGKIGFDFLGFNIRQYKTGKYQNKQGSKALIKPSDEKIKLHLEELQKIVGSQKSAKQTVLINRLMPVIRGWTNYYSTVVSKKTFEKINHLLTIKLLSWAKRRHPTKNLKWIVNKYWLVNKGEGWVFSDGKEKRLLRHNETPIARHLKIKGTKTPFDGDWSYWATRRGEYPGTPNRVSKALKRQKGKCLQCGLYFSSEDLIEVHHIDRNHFNNKWENLAALHRHCHDTVHGNRKPRIGNQELEDK